MSCRRLRSLQVCFSLKSLIAIQALLLEHSLYPLPNFERRESRTRPYPCISYQNTYLKTKVNWHMSSSSQVITEYGKQNIFARETPPQLVENYTSYPKEAEKTNGRWAMIGMISLLGAYVTTGQIIPGIF